MYLGRVDEINYILLPWSDALRVFDLANNMAVDCGLKLLES